MRRVSTKDEWIEAVQESDPGTTIVFDHTEPFCFHRRLRRRRHLMGVRNCWPPYYAERECPTCHATVEVRV